VRFSTKSSSANPQIEKQQQQQQQQQQDARAAGFSSNSSYFLTPNQASQTIAEHTRQRRRSETVSDKREA